MKIIPKNVLICPLDWGLGHVTRVIPIIKTLQTNGRVIYFGGNEQQFAFVSKEINQNVSFVHFPSYRVRYFRHFPISISILLQLPALLAYIVYEHFRVRCLIKKYHIDILISDNRYGLFSKKAKSVFITHQLSIIPPKSLRLFQKTLNFVNHFIISKYNQCWIPDIEGSFASGKLSNVNFRLKNVRFIGILSKFSGIKPLTGDYPTPQLVVVLSGNEPQRTIFEQKIIKRILQEKIKTVLLKTTPGNIPKTSVSECVTIIENSSSEEMCRMLMDAKKIIARAGYSTISDLLFLNKNAILVPTIGQTEQEYLAKYLDTHNVFVYMNEDDICLNMAFDKLNNCTPINYKHQNVISEIIGELFT